MLNDQFRHYLPCFSRCSVSIVSSIDLQNVRPSQNLLGFAGVYKGSYAVDVSVKYVVLRVLVRTVDAFFREHYGYVRSCHAGYVGMIVDRTAYFVLDDVQSFSLRSDLFTSYRDTADTLWRTLHQTVDMGLSHVTDNHDVEMCIRDSIIRLLQN